MEGHNQSAAVQNALFSWPGTKGIGPIGVIGQLYCSDPTIQPSYAPYGPYALPTPPTKNPFEVPRSACGVKMLKAIIAARSAGVRLSLEDGKLIAEASEVPPALVAQLRAARSHLLSLLPLREAAQPALTAERPHGARATEWADALRGLNKFLADGWADQALLLGWTGPELYGVPRVWARIDLTGVGLRIGRWQVTDVTAEAIAIELVRITLWKQADGSIEKRPEVYRQRFFRQNDLHHLPVTVTESATSALSESEFDLVAAIVAYMADRVEVSALPDRLLTVVGQPVDDDEGVLLDRIMMLENALAVCRIDVLLDRASGHVVLGHAWKGCPQLSYTLSGGRGELTHG